MKNLMIPTFLALASLCIFSPLNTCAAVDPQYTILEHDPNAQKCPHCGLTHNEGCGRLEI
ncbi:hypothetical protein PGT21_024112 [Puccinia graminis f. sp. tritici]|uniref:Secreted protein n=1 Tax=Puccinia graminis f. sp. tritici TaxID=56615 RepID=A0A5B0QKB0_PUCGR|nr:hypothetical protein PGT21_024112 [Puccinia graminis f. sp. tritici]KAA1113646.1 hypothetical protein PGTUg99_014487 [Puccinia graminis f. sp. tritici]